MSFSKLRVALSCLIFAAFVFLPACKGSTVPDGNGGGGVGPADRCGYCLNSKQAGGKVCTDKGTMDNSCLALCRGAEIFCEQSCPCPKVKKK